MQADSIEVLALVRLLEVLGEAVRGTSAKLRAAYPNIPWRQMIGTRNRIIHAYFNIDLDVIRTIVEDELPALLLQLEQIPSGPK